MKSRPLAIPMLFVMLIALAGVFLPDLILTTTVTSPSLNLPTGEAYRVFADPSDYQIVHLITPDTEKSQDTILSLIPTVTLASIAHSWQDVINFHKQKPIEAIIIDRSAYPLVDTLWTAAMAREGLVIATISLYAEAHAELRDSDCDRGKLPKPSPFPENYFLVTAHLIRTENSAG